MDKVTEISSDNESDCGDEIPFAERVAQKLPSNKTVIKYPKKTAASAFSDTDDEEEVVRAPRSKFLKNDTLEITPPPICSPAPPVRSTFNFVHDDHKRNDDVIAVRERGEMSGLITGGSVGLSKKEMKEVEKKKREEDKQQKKKIKENQKQNSKAIKEAEKLVNKQTDKSEVNKYLQVRNHNFSYLL